MTIHHKTKTEKKTDLHIPVHFLFKIEPNSKTGTQSVHNIGRFCVRQ